MFQHINRIFNILIICVLCVYVGYGIYLFWDYKANPVYYFTQSAPWYTGIQVYGVLTAIVLLALFIIKVFIRKKIK